MDRNLLKCIEAIFPEPIVTAVLHEKGDDFLVVEVNGAWMFRFPRRTEGQDVFEVERRFLRVFGPLSPVPVPKYECAGPRCAGYHKIEGAFLTADLLAGLGPGAAGRIAGQIGGFLSALHAFPVERARELGVTEGWGGWRLRAAAEFRARVAPMLSARTRRAALACLDAYLGMSYPRCVIHGDFYPPDHVLFKPVCEPVDKPGGAAQGGLSGIIDFGDVTIEDPAADLMGVLWALGEDYLRRVLECYTGEPGPDVWQRLRVRHAGRILFDAVIALEVGPEERLRRGLEEIEVSFGVD